jgi:hypothetical protein
MNGVIVRKTGHDERADELRSRPHAGRHPPGAGGQRQAHESDHGKAENVGDAAARERQVAGDLA